MQFHAGFTFRDALAIVPYLHDLGITHCYASPYLKARPGSTHGYDIIDHGCSTRRSAPTDDYDACIDALQAARPRPDLDTVPNHMGVVTNENAWWNDVLENGPASPYANYFDIAWQASPRPELRDQVLLPVLGEPYGDVLEAGQIRWHTTPAPSSSITATAASRWPRQLRRDPRPRSTSWRRLWAERPGARRISEHPDRRSRNCRAHGDRAAKRSPNASARRKSSSAGSPPGRPEPADPRLHRPNRALFNGKPGDPHSFDLLDDLLEEQSYRLSYWRVASDEINYRRFFDINELAALSMERETSSRPRTR